MVHDWRLGKGHLEGLEAARVQTLEREWQYLEEVFAKVVAAKTGADSTAPPGSERTTNIPTVAVYPKRSGGWHVLVESDGEAVYATVMPPPNSVESSGEILTREVEVLAEEFPGVVLVVDSAAKRLNLHAQLAVNRGDDWAVPYSYGLQRPTHVSTGISDALVVGDPSGDLPNARREAQVIARALSRTGINVQLLVGEAATGASLRTALKRGPRIFYYAGHAQYSGRDGWESRLRLAGASFLSVGDVLSMKRPPQIVVLSACKGASADNDHPGGGLGLGEAFVARGASLVVASPEAVRDDLGIALATSLDRRLGEGLSTARLERAVHGALVELYLVRADARSLRVLAP